MKILPKLTIGLKSLKNGNPSLNMFSTVRFKEDWSFTKYHRDYQDKGEWNNSIQNVEEMMLEYVKKHGQKGNIKSCIDSIDKFCAQHWMMNLGLQKTLIMKHLFNKYTPTRILQLGAYCGYSSLVFSHLTQAQICSVQICQQYIKIAKGLQAWAGVQKRNQILHGTVQTLKKQIQQKGPFDVIFIDHKKDFYLSDFKLLQLYGAIKKGTLVLGDNIIYPGPKGYLEHFKERSDYDSILYHSYLEYCNMPDALLVSEKL